MEGLDPPALPLKTPLTREERRLKRQARREKQRQGNIGRAAKMHELRLSLRSRVLQKPTVPHQPSTRTQYYIGCSGYFYWKWRGAFYPAALPTGEWFRYYSERFDTVEINASFYSWPTASGVRAWERATGRRKFVFTVKVCELITHLKRFVRTKTLIRDFSVIADLLEDRMGCFLYQLPPSHYYSPARLKAILSQLDHSRLNVVEFRHASWWNELVFAAFRKTGTIFCSCSAPRLPDVLIKTAEDVYIRFHGKERWYRHNYTKAELAEWRKRIEGSGAKRVWVYFNNDYQAQAPKNARKLARILVTDSGEKDAVGCCHRSILWHSTTRVLRSYRLRWSVPVWLSEPDRMP